MESQGGGGQRKDTSSRGATFSDLWLLAFTVLPLSPLTTTTTTTTTMATAVTIGLGALAAGLAGRHFLRSGRGAAEQWVKGGFRAKMDRREAIQILGLKYACTCYIYFAWS